MKNTYSCKGRLKRNFTLSELRTISVLLFASTFYKYFLQKQKQT